MLSKVCGYDDFVKSTMSAGLMHGFGYPGQGLSTNILGRSSWHDVDQ